MTERTWLTDFCKHATVVVLFVGRRKLFIVFCFYLFLEKVGVGVGVGEFQRVCSLTELQ